MSAIWPRLRSRPTASLRPWSPSRAAESPACGPHGPSRRGSCWAPAWPGGCRAKAPEQTTLKQQRAQRAAADHARDARPSLYRWRDAGGVLQITDRPPRDRPFERIEQQPDRAIEIRGERSD
ncbi:MAG TPA: DUF4124 domain-containing protein [Pseudoxanthomonas sp.]|nr:DUF4124 domain-containing protein [Pseudoxanthomonas sp.]